MTTLDLSRFSRTHKLMLYFYAYLGPDYAQSYMNAFRKMFNLTMKECDDATKSLLKQGYVSRGHFYSSIIRINSTYRVLVLADLVKNSPKDALKFANVFQYAFKLPYFVRLVEYAVGITQEKPAIELVFEGMEYIYPIISNPLAPKMMEFLSDANYMRAVEEILSTLVNNDIPVKNELLEALCNPVGRPDQLRQDLADRRALQLYLQDGILPQLGEPSKTRPWQLAYSAIRATNLGDYETASKLFVLSLRALNGRQSIKNIYYDIFPAYYHIMALGRLGTPQGLKKLEQIDKKINPTNEEAFVVMQPLIQTFLSSDHKPRKFQIDNLIDAKDESGNKLPELSNFGILFQHYFELGTYETKPTMPRYAIMRHEMSEYLELSDEERAKLQESFGDKPALTSIHRKKDWEWAIDEILMEVEAEAPADKPMVETAKNMERIIYATSASGEIVTPYLQTLLKSGRWSMPKAIAKKRFEAREVPCMDSTDTNIASHMKHPYYSSIPVFPSMYKVAIYLVDSNKLFLQDGTDVMSKPVEVTEGTPYAKVEPKANFFEIVSNVTLADLQNHRTGDKVVIQRDPTHYEVLTMTERQRNILTKLLKLKGVPTTDETTMRKFLTRLEDVIEVRSSLFDSKAVPTIDGSDHVVVKVLPDGTVFDLRFYSLPLRGGATYCLPGYGKAVIYDNTTPETNYRVKRNMIAELENYQNLIDMLEDNKSDDTVTKINEDDYAGTLDIDSLLALMSHARQNPDKISIEWPSGKELRLKQTPASSSWNVGIKSDNGWFDIEGDVRLDEKTVISMAQMLQLVSESKGRFIKLNEQDFIEIDQKLRRQLERLESLAVKNRNKLQISPFNASLLDKDVLDGEIHIESDNSLAELQQRIATSAKYAPEVPASLCATLRPYQVDGFQWMARLAQWGAGACLADDMGLGKTVQTIAFLLLKANEGPALIAAPASVVPNWMSEINKFAPTLQPVILNKVEDREKTLKDAGPFDVILTTYGILNTADEALFLKEWTTVCLDEAHTIKNRETKMSHAVMQLRAKYRIILTGTPIQNHLGELWNLFRFINPGLLGSFDIFKQKYVNPITLNNDRTRRKALQRIIKPFMLRRTKNEVMDDLPDKTEIILPVELSPEELAMYETMRESAANTLEVADKVDVNALAEITKLRRAACSMELVVPKWKGGSSKIQAFIDLVKDFQKEGNRMLVFSQFTSFLELARKALDAAGEKYLYFDGSTTMKQRERIVEEFRQGNCSLFLISLKAGGLGLNLTEANYVVHLDPWWNPAIEQQATDRAYRIGQNRNVTVYHFVAKNTIEEKIRRLHRTKRDLADSLLEGTGMAGQLSVKDILELISQE